MLVTIGDNSALPQANAKLVSMGIHEQIAIEMAPGPAAVSGPVDCVPQGADVPGPPVKAIVGADDGDYLSVRYGLPGGGDGRLPTVPRQPSDGAVLAQYADLGEGDAVATVRMRRAGVVVLSASYDPGWTATVNGRRRSVWMAAPALVAVDVPTGTDHVVFRFHGYGDYPGLLALSGLTVALLGIAPACARRSRVVRFLTVRRKDWPTGRDGG